MRQRLLSLIALLILSIQAYSQAVLCLRDGSTKYKTDCIGTLFDSGGEFNPYWFNEDGKVVISPTNASNVTLSFTFIDIEPGFGTTCNYDILSIYDGPTVSNNALIGEYCNNALPPSTITSTGGSITIRFESDGTNVDAGFEIHWQCGSGTSTPVVDFDVNKDESCDGQIEFINLSSVPVANWLWDFGDGSTSIAKNPIHTYGSNGLYTVKLFATNAAGTDSLVKSNSVNINLPDVPVVTNDTVCIGDTAAISGSAAGGITWYDDSTGGNLISSNNTLVISNVVSGKQYWAESSSTAPLESVGETDIYIGAGGYNSSSGGIFFDVFEELDLVSVDVYSNQTGNRTFQLTDQNGTVLQTKVVSMPSSPFAVRAVLDFRIRPGNNYYLRVTGTSNNLWRNTRGPVFPYTIPNKISLKQSNGGRTRYSYFYNWRIRSLNCTSQRVPSTVSIDTTCNLTSITENGLSNDQVFIFPNPTRDFVIISNGIGKQIQDVIIIDGNGKQVAQQLALSNEKVVKVNTEGLSSGIYFMKVLIDSEWVVRKMIKQ